MDGIDYNYIDNVISSNKGYFIFEELKALCNKNVVKMGTYFEELAKYKSIGMVYGNCQSEYLTYLMLKNDEFKNKYVMCLMPWIQDIKDEKQDGFSSVYMKYVKLFIYQNVSDENAFSSKLSTNSILPLLSIDTIKISIPYAYFNGYFPQYKKNYRNDNTNRGRGHVPYGDKVIETLLELRTDVGGAAEKALDENLFSKEEVEENLNNTFYELRRREKKCDIIISDFIEENYKREYLFYTPSHPTNICMRELANRVLKCLGYELLNSIEGVPANDGVEMFIYPAVKKKLGLSFQKEKFSLFKHEKDCSELNFAKYYEQYSNYCFPELSKEVSFLLRNISIKHMLELHKNVSDRRTCFLELQGKCVHLNCYLTANSDIVGTIMRINNKYYAPRVSYITQLLLPIENKSIPIVINADGRCVINKKVRKSSVLLIDTMYFIE